MKFPGEQNKGGEFIIKSTPYTTVFTKDELTEEQRMIAKTVEEFCIKEIQEKIMERGKEFDVTNPEGREEVKALLKKAGALGLCSVAIPEAYGGMNLDFKTNTLFSMAMAHGFSFATTLGCQISIGSLPIVYYGTEAQKQKYLPGLATAELIGAYALTEPEAGSDANSGKSRAVLSDDGTHYLLTGRKIWITNGGIADVFIVFARIDDDKNLSAFIVERGFDGFTIGPEERKMGIKGSSTTALYFDRCKVPVENLLGKRNEGFKMALNILNNGRMKAGAGAVGGAAMALTKAVEYATERIQFGKPIASFGAIQYKIGDITSKILANEAAIFRVAGLIDQKEAELKSQGIAEAEAKVKALREYAIEASIIKVEGTALGCYAVDECMQIYGGMGYAVETGIEMGYRDARITKIYEGTNEINRLLAVGELSKRGLITREIDLMAAGKKLPYDLLKRWIGLKAFKGTLSRENHLVDGFKKTFLLVSGAAGRKLGKKLIDEQEIVLNLYDILAGAFMSESIVLFCQKACQLTDDKALNAARKAAMQLYLYEARKRIVQAAAEGIDSFAEGMEYRVLKKAVHVFLTPYPVNPKNLRRHVARYIIEHRKYCL